MKNTLVFLNIEGIGLNPKWKGNYLKLVHKPNLNNLISGIYPWSIISNNEEIENKKISKKLSVSKDIEKNFIQSILGDDKQLTTQEKFNKIYKEKNILSLPILDKIKKHCDEHNSCAHLFFLLSSNRIHILIDQIKLTINALLKKGVKIVLHVIADGKDCIPYSFSSHIDEFFKFVSKRKIPIASISGRDNVFIKEGYSFNDCEHIDNYFSHIIGLGKNAFDSPLVYSNENLFSNIEDNKIAPAINRNIYKNFIEENDSVIFLDYDPDVYSSLLWKLADKKEGYFKNLQICSLSKIYNDFNCKIELFFDDLNNESSIVNKISKKDKKTLIISLAHKKGFIEKYYGNKKTSKTNLIKREVLLLPKFNNENEYIFAVNKLLIDKTIKEIGKYDLIIIHNPILFEIAKNNDLNLTKFAFETFDKNLGRLINFVESTGNVLSILSNFGSIEKLVNKKFYSTPYNKSSPTFFIFSNGDLGSKQLVSNFYSVYSTILSTLGVTSDIELKHKSLITSSYTISNLAKKNEIDYDLWKNDVALPLIKYFDDNKSSLYEDFQKNETYLIEKQNYIVLKELLKIQDKFFLTSDARKRIYEYLFEYVKFNKIDFENFKYNVYKIISDIYKEEKDDKLNFKNSTIAFKFFDHNIWIKKIKKTDYWVKKVKIESNPITKRDKLNKNYGNIHNVVSKNYLPYSFFGKLFISEMKVLETNSAIDIAKFYDSIRTAIDKIYKTYFEDKIKFYSSEIEDEESEVTMLPYDLYKISKYYEAFQDIVKIIDDNRSNLELYDLNFSKKSPYLKNKNVSILKSGFNELNYLLKLILPIRKAWELEIGLYYNQLLSNDKTQINNYNVKYARRIAEEIEKVVYANEFIDGVDLEVQKKLKLKLSNKVKELGVFDLPKMAEDKHIEKLEYEKIVDNAIYIPSLLRFKKEYDLTGVWTQKRLFDKNILPFLSKDPLLNVAEKIEEIRKIDVASDKIAKYIDKSVEWRIKVKREPVLSEDN